MDRAKSVLREVYSSQWSHQKSRETQKAFCDIVQNISLLNSKIKIKKQSFLQNKKPSDRYKINFVALQETRKNKNLNPKLVEKKEQRVRREINNVETKNTNIKEKN
jgi:hypothetical protein